MDALVMNQVTKKYKDFSLKDVSFKVEGGTIMGLIGANGAGKTTAIRLIMNMIERDGGSIKVFGMDNLIDEIAVKNEIGYVSEDNFLYFNANLTQYAKLYRSMFSKWDEELFRKLVSEYELPMDKKFQTFSKGTKLKAMMALALSHKPRLLLLDEPTSGLDPAARSEMLSLFREFVSDGERAVLFSTHITSDLDKVADYITLILDGKVVESMSMMDIEEKYAIVSGENEKICVLSKYLIGTRKGNNIFEALILRKNAEFFKDCQVTVPNVEKLLTFSIYNERKNSAREGGHLL